MDLGLTHGTGNYAVIMPDDRFLFAADFAIPGALPISTGPDYNFKAWEQTLEKILTFPWDKAVHTHTARQDPLALSTREDLELLVQYLKVKYLV